MARPWGEQTSARSQSNPTVDPYGRPLFLDTDQAIVDAVQQIAQQRDVAMATVAMAWVLKQPVIDAPIVGATKPQHPSDAVVGLVVDLTEEEIRSLEEPYTPREPTYF